MQRYNKRHYPYQRTKSTSFTPFSQRRFEKKSRNKLILAIIFSAMLLYALVMWILPFFIGSLSFINQFRSGNTSKKEDIKENAALAPPVFSIPYTATNSAMVNIPGYAVPKTKVELYIDDELKGVLESSDDGSFTFEDIELNIGHNNIYGKTVEKDGSKSLPSKTITLLYDNTIPSLEVKEPQDNQEFKDQRINVSGTTDASDAVGIEINNVRAIINSDGTFSRSINLQEGENSVVVKAIDRAGNVNQITRTVFYKPEPPTPTPSPTPTPE